MKIELLITTMNATDFSLCNSMNIQTDALICNQTNSTSLKEIEFSGGRVRLLSTETKGKSINQNIGIFYSDADVIIFADDDVVFVDNYERIVQNFFRLFPDADVVKFYCESTNTNRPLAYLRPKDNVRASRKNLMSAGTPCLAVKKSFLDKNSILFDIGIGPGTIMGCGEDSLFINDLFKKKATIYLSTELIATVNQENSSWFCDYNDAYFANIGYVYKHLYGLLAPFFMLRRSFILHKTKVKNKSILQMFLLMKAGMRI